MQCSHGIRGCHSTVPARLAVFRRGVSRIAVTPMNRLLRILGGVAAVVGSILSVEGTVVLNEIQYHPPDDRDDLQFVELHNAGNQPVRLAGWKLTRGVKAELPDVVLAPGGLGVLCSDPRAFRDHYGTQVPVLGTFQGRLKHGGERIELTSAAGAVVDSVTFDDRAPWPLAPDGTGASLERRTPGAPGDDPYNWGSSVLPRTALAGGTPGQTNSIYSPRRLPWVTRVEWNAPSPGQALEVVAELGSAEPVEQVQLLWAAVSSRGPAREQTVVMQPDSGINGPGRYRARIPGQESGQLVRFRLEVTTAGGALRQEPDPHDLRPTFSAYVAHNTNSARIPEIRLMTLGNRERPGSSLRARPGRPTPEPVRGGAVLVVFPTNGGPVQVFDHIRLTPRQDGWKVRLHADAPYQGMTTLNVVYQGAPRWLLSEYLGYELFRRAGVATPLAGHFRTWVEGRPVGTALFVEQPNASFLRRVGRDPDGNLYKILWYEQGLEGQHEKKNNPQSGHEDLRAVVQHLGKGNADDAWAFIDRQFAVDACASYFAVSQCIQNWDGYFNNYFTYHAPGPDGRWELFPWDLDKTWGDYDGASPAYDWYGLPLTFGMTGDREPARWFASRRHLWGSVEWWRPPGWFSGPLLANPQFRARYLRRVHELCQTEFTEARFGPVIQHLEANLEPEVRWRAEQFGEPVSEAVGRFRADLDSFRRQLVRRREVLLTLLQKEGVPPR